MEARHEVLGVKATAKHVGVPMLHADLR